MNNNNNNLGLKLLVSFILFGVLALLIIFFYRLGTSPNSPKKVSVEYKKIVLDNDLAKAYSFKEETSSKDSIDNIVASSKILKSTLQKRAEITRTGEDVIATTFIEIDSHIEKKDYAKSLELTKERIKKTNVEIENYKSEQSDAFRGINVAAKSYTDRGAVLANVRVVGSWAIATIVPVKFKTEPANIIFKKSADKWERFLGPGSHLDKKVLASAGAPKEIVENTGVTLTKSLLETIKL